MAADRRPTRPLRRGFGALAAVVATADVAVATAVQNNDFGIPTVPPDKQMPMLGYGLLLLLVGLWAIVTSFGGRRPREVPAARPSVESQVIQRLREQGWYVADGVVLPHVDVDHVAIGPSGVLAIQTRWTDRSDPRGKAPARARIAAHQLRRALAQRELDVEVVPAVLTFGPGLTEQPGGAKVVDAVAVLNGYQADEWLEQLARRPVLPEALVHAVRDVVADVREPAARVTGTPAAPVREAAGVR